MQLSCPDAVPNFLGIFDFSIAPSLLFYSYIPILIVSMFFGIFILLKNKKSIQNILFFLIALSFSLFLVNEIVQWIAVPVGLVYLGWSLAPLFQIFVWLFSIYFFYNYLYEKKLSFGLSVLLFSFSLPVTISLSMRSNILNFDLTNCEGNIGWIWYYLYFFQITSIFLLLSIGLAKVYKEKKETKVFNKQIIILTLGIFFFLLSFSLSNIFGEISKVYEVNLVGPIGMVIFLGLLAYMIVKYKAFNIKLIGAQAIMTALVFLVGSQFFYIHSFASNIIAVVTMLFILISGRSLIRSVKKEVAQKEELEIVNAELVKLDQAKSEFISIASHQLRTPLTVIKGYVSMILDGNFGALTNKLKEPLDKVFLSNQRLINLVEDLLNVSRIESGRLQVILENRQLEDLVASVYEELKAHAAKKGLKFSYNKPETKLPMVRMDEEKMRQVIINLVDNSIKYTPKGSVTVSLKLQANNVLFCVSDSGLGVKPEDMPNLFKKFSRGTGMSLVHTDGTGLGLYVVRQIVELHGGHAWVESDGEYKGSKFYFDMPFIK